ncbi:MAG: MATE family efflux transporter, partial [Mesorhizobium sp.]
MVARRPETGPHRLFDQAAKGKRILDQVSAAANGRSFVVTNRSVLAIAVPMTLAYLTTPLLGV